MLAVHLDQGADDVGDGGDGGHPSLELGPAAPLDQHLAGDHDLAVLVLDPGGRQGGGDLEVVAGVQAAFDQRGRPAGTDRARVGPPPEQQGEGVTTMVLPAPVSPVSTLRPAETSRRASSMTPRSRMRSSANITCDSSPPGPPGARRRPQGARDQSPAATLSVAAGSARRNLERTRR